MAADIHKVEFQISATDQATRVIQGVAGSVKGLHGTFIALAGAATAALGAGGVAAFVADAVRYRAALDDLSDTTGDNVRTLDAMARQARVSGLEFEQLSSGLTKFARNLNAAGDEGKDAARALEALGLNVEELRAQKPADAMLEVARALDKYEDGAAKVAVAMALMGKEGAKQLPFLKDLAQAGELQGKISAEQAAQAERLNVEWRRLVQTFEDGKQAIASGLIPSVAGLIAEMRTGIEIAGSFGAALRLFGWGISPFASKTDQIKTFTAELERARDSLRTGAGGRLGMADAARDIPELEKKIAFLKAMQRQEALAGRTGAEFMDARDLRAGRKDRLDFPPGKPSTGARAERSDALTTEKILKMQLDSQEAYARKVEHDNAELHKFLDDTNKKLVDQAESWRDLLDPTAKFYRQIKEIAVLVDKGLLSPEEGDIALLRVNQEMGKLSKDVKDQVKETDDFARQMGLTFSSAFEDAIRGGKKFSDVLKGIANDILGIMLRKNVTEPLGNWASGLFAGGWQDTRNPSGGGFLGSLSGLFGGMGGWGGGAMSSGAFGIGMMGFAEGTDYVPYDMVAKIHQGEKIVPAAENRGGAPSVVNLHFHSADAQGARSLLMQHSETIKSIVRKGYNDNGRSPGF